MADRCFVCQNGLNTANTVYLSDCCTNLCENCFGFGHRSCFCKSPECKYQEFKLFTFEDYVCNNCANILKSESEIYIVYNAHNI